MIKKKLKKLTLTIDDTMLNCETKDFSKSSYTNREINKNYISLFIFCSLPLEGTKGAEGTQVYNQHLWDLEKLFVLNVFRLCIF